MVVLSRVSTISSSRADIPDAAAAVEKQGLASTWSVDVEDWTYIVVPARPRGLCLDYPGATGRRKDAAKNCGVTRVTGYLSRVSHKAAATTTNEGIT